MEELGGGFRLLGYDVLIYRESDRKKLVMLSLKEARIIITRDKKLSNKAFGVIRINSSDFRQQLKELKRHGIEINTDMLYSRCSICNGEIIPVNKVEVEDKVPPYVYENINEFYICSLCKKIYWSGTHRKLILDELKKII